MLSPKLRGELESFLRIATSIQEMQVIKSESFNPSFSMSFDSTTGALQISESQIDIDKLRSLVIEYRKIIMEGESSNINYLWNQIWIHAPRDGNFQKLFELRDTWNDALKSSLFNLHINDKAISPELARDVILNGVWFHSDIEYNNLWNGLAPDIQRLWMQQVIELIHTHIQIIFGCQWHISEILRIDGASLE